MVIFSGAIKAAALHRRSMERSCLAWATSSVLSLPTALSPQKASIFKQLPTNNHFFSTSPSTSTISTGSSRVYAPGIGTRGTILRIRASEQDFSSTRQTLSSNWDVANYTTAPSWLPRFEELDTSNMLLR